MKVKDPEGQTWRVTRRWTPWRRKLDELPDGPDWVGDLGDDPISAVVGGVLLTIVLVLALIVALELALLLLVLPFTIAGRVLFGRHWIVEARRGFTPYHEEEAGDWAASRERIEALAAAIERGELPEHTLAG